LSPKTVDAALQMRRIGVSRRIIVASPSLIEVHGEPKDPQDLPRLPLLDASEQSGLSVWRLTDWSSSRGWPPAT
jgi:hypothetical protein